MRKTYKQKESESCAERKRLRGEVICDDRMKNGKQRGRRGERVKGGGIRRDMRHDK